MALVVAAALLALQWVVVGVLVFGAGAAVVWWEHRVPRYGALAALAGLVVLPMAGGAGLWVLQLCSKTAPPDVLWALPVCIGSMCMRYWAAGMVPIAVACCWWLGAVAGWLVEARAR